MVSYWLSPHSFEKKGKERAVSLSTSNLKSSCTYEKVFFLLTKKQKIKATLATFLRGNLWLGNCEAWYGRRALQACSPTWSTGYKKKTIVNCKKNNMVVTFLCCSVHHFYNISFSEALWNNNNNNNNNKITKKITLYPIFPIPNNL